MFKKWSGGDAWDGSAQPVDDEGSDSEPPAAGKDGRDFWGWGLALARWLWYYA